jgi:hypothetical protein
MKKTVLCIAAMLVSFSLIAAEEMPFVEGMAPPAAEEGYAWCLVTKPAVVETVTEKVETTPATFYLERVAPQYEWRDEIVEVSPAYKKPVTPMTEWNTERAIVAPEEAFEYVVTPAKYEEVEQEIITTPAYTTTEVIPAVFREEVVEYLVEPAKTAQQKVACANIAGQNEVQGDCFTSVVTPAQKQSYVKKVLVKPAEVKEVQVPAIKKTIKVRKMVEPPKVEKVAIKLPTPAVTRNIPRTVGKVEYIDVPAQTQAIKKLVETVPASTRRVEVPAKFKTIEKQIVKEQAKPIWRKVPLEDCNKPNVRGIVERYKSVPAMTGDAVKTVPVKKSKVQIWNRD